MIRVTIMVRVSETCKDFLNVTRETLIVAELNVTMRNLDSIPTPNMATRSLK